jgi:hypothetical protein
MNWLTQLLKTMWSGVTYSSKWDDLRKLGQSRLVALTILVPLLGYMILFNEQIIKYLEISSPYFHDIFITDTPADGDGLSISLAYRLYFFYFGFTFLAIGNIIYYFCCPVLVKEYGSAAAFHATEGPIMNRLRLKSFALPFLEPQFEPRCRKINLSVSQVWGLEASPMDKDAGSAKFRDRLREEMTQFVESTFGREQDGKANLMTAHFVPLKTARPVARWTCLFFYGAGFLVLLVPTTHSFMSVVATIAAKI